MYLVIGVVLALSVLHSIQEHLTCCYPTLIEGQGYFVEDEVIQFYATDYSVQRRYETFDPDGDVFDIFDMENGLIYHFNGDTCTFQNSPLTQRFAQCITDEDDSVTTLDVGGLLTRKRVYAKRTTFDYYETLSIVDVTPSKCSPLFVQTVDPEGRSTIIYSHLRPSVTDRKLYTAFDNCVEAS